MSNPDTRTEAALGPTGGRDHTPRCRHHAHPPILGRMVLPSALGNPQPMELRGQIAVIRSWVGLLVVSDKRG